ncbi:TPA: UbiX family flavin prenyltransferase [Methanocaldococcus jannaschii]|uniref:Flavin prenyltransferase UbiX n=2 Tax=Methanocaldococcus jannaschii TaxID=2190 RepID=UBIX_METJA|nr:UbiX family flavin prenyltransferase [Methanocaldococcus jannaschii]Q57566.1 RecName: Full=Flavin prenyltransferase UbiX [Methanocaldococcus jannaschii DSM 2661]AAB98082.1 Phenylacrylic acid decarboxylase [Methanocaldococcus jannaschii DSM 2661]6M8V_A Chain A, Flavin prenyltransferase UbiX [Methanocaldococcus jannaschii DSM 2661]HII59664.1 UbiX family flavin prenyltransferase [Methanocaldococcus jannaschii]
MKIIVCITGASGVIYAKRLLEVLKDRAEVNLIISNSAKKIIKEELDIDWKEIKKLATDYYENDDFFSPLASGSNKFDAVVVVPCSMKTLSAIANGYSANLIVRVCDIALKERRKLIIMPREMPFNSIHLENMLKLSNLGAIVMPPIPAFYNKPKNVNDIINFVVGRVLDILGIDNSLFKRWGTV